MCFPPFFIIFGMAKTGIARSCELENTGNQKIYFHSCSLSVSVVGAAFSHSLNVLSSSYLSLSTVVNLFFATQLSCTLLVSWVEIMLTSMLTWIAKYLKCVEQPFFALWTKFTPHRGSRKCPCISFGSHIKKILAVNLDIALTFSTGMKSYLSIALEFHALGENEISIIPHVKVNMSC